MELDAPSVDFRNAESIKSSMTALVNNGQKDLILNLTKVTFMDSSGLSVILFGKRACEEVGGTFCVCGLQSYVNNLFNLTNLTKTVRILADENEA